MPCRYGYNFDRNKEILNFIKKDVGRTAHIVHDDPMIFQVCDLVTICSLYYRLFSVVKAFLVKVIAHVTNYYDV